MVAALGVGRWKTPGRKTLESCPVLDVNQLSAMGYLQPGWAGQWVVGSDGAGRSRGQAAESILAQLLHRRCWWCRRWSERWARRRWRWCWRRR
jgi:hypothetical protein